MSDAFVLRKPCVTEKSTDLSQGGKYVFIVKPRATKPEIKKAVQALYRVHVTRVNVVNRPAKEKRFRNMRGRQSGYKKAIVTLAPGEKIEAHA